MLTTVGAIPYDGFKERVNIIKMLENSYKGAKIRFDDDIVSYEYKVKDN
ncbi:hypothetical protein [Virgibacillus profundi]|nr:hypothetical protein [Virgibacillus profundi]